MEDSEKLTRLLKRKVVLSIVKDYSDIEIVFTDGTKLSVSANRDGDMDTRVNGTDLYDLFQTIQL